MSVITLFHKFLNKNTAAPYCMGLKGDWISATITQFPVDTGAVVEVTCSYSDAINEGSNEVTCKAGKIYSFSKEPSCSISGKKEILFFNT